MKLCLARSHARLLAALALALSAASVGCASRAPAPPVTSSAPLTAADFSDPAWTPPDASGSGVSLDESKLTVPTPAPRRAPRPRHEPSPNAHEAPRGSVRPASE
jgi:hypothetical protein